VLSYVPASPYLSYFGEGLSESLAYSNIFGFLHGGVAIPGAGPALICAERCYSSKKKAQKGNALSELAIQDCLTKADDQRRFWDDYKHELGADQDSLIDEDGEEDLLQAFHHSNFAGPHDTPNLGSRDAYARHCMLNMLALCGYSADAKTHPQSEQLLESLLDDKVKKNPMLRDQWLASIRDRLARISPEEKKEILAKYNVFEQGITPEEVKKRLKAIRQTSIAYGRLLQKYHSDRREAQVTGAMVGPAVITSAVTASPAPLVGAGLLWASRKGYRAFVGRSSMVNLEFDENDPVNGDLHGRGGGPIIPASLARKRGGAGIYQHAVLVQCAGKTQADLTDVQKYWYKHINLHASRPRYASTHWKKPEDLAVYCAAAVQKDLTKVKQPKVSADSEKTRQAEEERRHAQQEQQYARSEETRVTSAIATLNADISSKNERIRILNASIDPQKIASLDAEVTQLIAEVAKKKSELAAAEQQALHVKFMDPSNYQRALQGVDAARSAHAYEQTLLDQKAEARRKINDAAVTQAVADLTVEIQSLKTHQNAKDAELKKISSYVAEAEQRYRDADQAVKDLKKDVVSKNLDLADIGMNADIQRAFAVKIQEEFAAQKAAGWNLGGALGKGTKTVVTSGPVKAVAKDAGEVLLATGFFGGAAYGGALYTGVVSAPAVAALIGGGVFIAKTYEKLKKRIFS